MHSQTGKCIHSAAERMIPSYSVVEHEVKKKERGATQTRSLQTE